MPQHFSPMTQTTPPSPVGPAACCLMEGVPLLVETHVGATSLKKRALPMLKELNRAVGQEAEVGRLTIVDSEFGHSGAI